MKKKLIGVLILLGVLGVLGVVGSVYFYSQYTKANNELQDFKSDPTTLQNAAVSEAKKLIAAVSKLIDLPQDEEPTVATVTDANKLRDQEFFRNAKNGDKVLIYTKAKKAILYDPKANKVINVAPINLGTPSAQVQQAKIVIRNGTANPNAVPQTESGIKKVYPQANIAGKGNASSLFYTNSVIVLFNDNAKAAADNLAKELGIPIGELPQGEIKPSEGDILVILGSDKFPSQSPNLSPNPNVNPVPSPS
jgi:hypothetical protein